METKDLFHVVDNGYSREEVDKYIDRLKTEYKKVHDFAKTTETNAKAVEANNEKLKKLARVLSEENKKLKAESAPAAEAVKAIPEGTIESVDRINSLLAEITKESEALKAKLQ